MSFSAMIATEITFIKPWRNGKSQLSTRLVFKWPWWHTLKCGQETSPERFILGEKIIHPECELQQPLGYGSGLKSSVCVLGKLNIDTSIPLCISVPSPSLSTQAMKFPFQDGLYSFRLGAQSNLPYLCHQIWQVVRKLLNINSEWKTFT